MPEHFVIVGGGQAASQAAASARQAGFDGRITLVADEPHLPYQRPPLSKAYLAGEIDPERLLLKPGQFYESREIDVRRGTVVAGIDPKSRHVALAGGETIAASKILLATGSEPRRLAVPGADLKGIHSVRSIDDIDAIRREFHSGARLLIVGAGYIGLEVAAVARRLGLEVTVIEAASDAMSRSVCTTISDFFVDRHRAAGVEVRFDTTITAFHGDDSVASAETAGGERLDCDLAIVAIGIVPRTGLAEAAGLAIDNGIAVDASGRTEADSIFAAGDCTSHVHPWVNARVRLESVQNAIEQGKAVGSVVGGTEYRFDAVPWFWSDQYDLKLQLAGLGAGHDQRAIRGRPEDGSFSVFYLSGGRVIAAASVNDPRSFMTARKRLVDKPAWSADAIADPDTDLATLPG